MLYVAFKAAFTQPSFANLNPLKIFMFPILKTLLTPRYFILSAVTLLAYFPLSRSLAVTLTSVPSRGAEISTPVTPVAPGAKLDAAGIEALGKKFFERIDLGTPGLEKPRGLVEKGSYKEALDAYRDVLLDDLKKRDCGKMGLQWSGNSDADELMKGVARISRHAGGISKNNIGLPGAIEWTKPTVDEILNEPAGIEPESRESSNQDWSTHLSSMNQTNCLVIAYVKTHDPKYAAFWLATWGDFAMRQKKMVQLADQTKYHALNASWGFLFVAMRMENFWVGLLQVAKEMPRNQYARLSSTSLAEMLISMADDHADVQADRLKNTSGAPNQAALAAKVTLMEGLFFKGEKKASEWTNIARDFTVKYYGSINLPDGTNFEQAINYNRGNPDLAIGIFRVSGSNRPDWLKSLIPNIDATLHYLSGMIRNGTHHGALPRMGQDDSMHEKMFRNYLEYFPNDDLARILNHVYGDRTLPQPTFTSCAFPYSGYYVMRTGWGKEDAYSFFKASRRPRGHARNDNTAIHFICAYGRDLLIDCGSSSYGKHRINPYLQSSFSKNTIQVDGKGQDEKPAGMGTRGPETTGTEAIPNRWHTSSRFDFAEGFYASGYEDPKIMVRHERQVLFLRKQQIWIVTDRLRGESSQMPTNESHIYTQTWNFPEDFAENQVGMDAEGKTITTQNPASPNVSLRHFASFHLDYKKYYGNENPILGWVRVQGVHPLKAVSIHANWSGAGEQVLVTLIIPSKKGEERVKTIEPRNGSDAGAVGGFSLVLNDGTLVDYQAALNSAELKASSLAVKGADLLMVTPPHDLPGGIVIGGSQFLSDGKELPLTTSDMEFTLKNGKLEEIMPIHSPAN